MQPISAGTPQALAALPAIDSLAILSGGRCVSVLAPSRKELHLELQGKEHISCIATWPKDAAPPPKLQGKR